jgi:hypothetical protein
MEIEGEGLEAEDGLKIRLEVLFTDWRVNVTVYE